MPRARGFRFLDHITDLEIEAYGKDLSEAFENAGRAVEHAMVDLKAIKRVESREINLEEKDVEGLLYSWIESLISLEDTDGLLFSGFTCKISSGQDMKYRLDAVVEGEKFDPVRHEQKTAIKAPTFHDMKITTGKQKVTMRFLVDL